LTRKLLELFSVDPYDNLPTQGVQAMENGAVCLSCGKTFKSMGNATRHYKEKHLTAPGQNYKCLICGKAYSLARNRNEHMAIAHGYNPKKAKGPPIIPKFDPNQSSYF